MGELNKIEDVCLSLDCIFIRFTIHAYHTVVIIMLKIGLFLSSNSKIIFECFYHVKNHISKMLCQ